MNNRMKTIELLRDVKVYNQGLADQMIDSSNPQNIITRHIAQTTANVADDVIQALHGNHTCLRIRANR